MKKLNILVFPIQLKNKHHLSLKLKKNYKFQNLSNYLNSEMNLSLSKILYQIKKLFTKKKKRVG